MVDGSSNVVDASVVTSVVVEILSAMVLFSYAVTRESVTFEEVSLESSVVAWIVCVVARDDVLMRRREVEEDSTVVKSVVEFVPRLE